MIQLKRNRKKLFEHIDQQTTQHKPLDSYTTKEKQKGRIENRKYDVYRIDTDTLPPGWMHINSAIKVRRWGTRQDTIYEETAFYLSNMKLDAQSFGTGIRNHWMIENLLHREKDVQQNEDHNKVRKKNLATIISLLQTLVLSLFRAHGEPSITKANEKYANKVRQSYNLISKKFKCE